METAKSLTKRVKKDIHRTQSKFKQNQDDPNINLHSTEMKIPPKTQRKRGKSSTIIKMHPSSHDNHKSNMANTTF